MSIQFLNDNERKQQIEYMNKKYETEWSRIKLCYEKTEED